MRNHSAIFVLVQDDAHRELLEENIYLFQAWELIYLSEHRKAEIKNFKNMRCILTIIVFQILLQKQRFLQSRKAHLSPIFTIIQG